jgi:phosphoribosylformylglycinamidine synthase subunit PurQ / glutaminase
MKFGIVTFPGSNCDYDAFQAVAETLGEDAGYLWHKDHTLQGADVVVLPGGFSYGDYLRAGAIARFSPIMREVAAHARRGGPVLGICNGFQIACEAGLLPGALIRNRQLRFVCRLVHLRVETSTSVLTGECSAGDVLEIPIKHGEGQFVATPDEVRRIEEDGLVLFRYCSAAGEVGEEWNPNGATDHIAGLRNEGGNVCGLMPHPEHAVDPDVGPVGGQPLFESLLSHALETVSA